MTLSLILAWIAVLLGIMTSLKYIARKSKSAKLNRFFHKIHIPMGILMVIMGLLHGLLAGNAANTRLTHAYIGTLLFSFNWGTACLIVAVLLGISYLLRKVLKKNWMRVHRILTVVLLVFMVIHIADVGIRLPSQIFNKLTDKETIQDNFKEQVNSSIEFSGVQLKDGVYEGSAKGYKSTIKVSVTVENGAVTNIEILEENETPDFFKRAQGITQDIIDNQTLNVDAVSGATYSSAGIINAVNNALESAVTEGELEHNDVETYPDSKHENNDNNSNENNENGSKTGKGNGKGKQNY
ncbi:MAG: FMN-binding protein [Lachnospira sp.]